MRSYSRKFGGRFIIHTCHTTTDRGQSSSGAECGRVGYVSTPGRRRRPPRALASASPGSRARSSAG
eukprot:1946564-Prymnesium_polylepis.1